MTNIWQYIPQLQTQTLVLKNILDPTWAHRFLYHGKERKHYSKRKWTDRGYRVQDRKDVPHTSVKILCATTQFLVLSFFGPHKKPHGVRGLSKYYHLQL